MTREQRYRQLGMIYKLSPNQIADMTLVQQLYMLDFDGELDRYAYFATWDDYVGQRNDPT